MAQKSTAFTMFLRMDNKHNIEFQRTIIDGSNDYVEVNLRCDSGTTVTTWRT